MYLYPILRSSASIAVALCMLLTCVPSSVNGPGTASASPTNETLILDIERGFVGNHIFRHEDRIRAGVAVAGGGLITIARRAIEAFQRERGLLSDGKVSDGLIAVLQIATSQNPPPIILTIDGIDLAASQELQALLGLLVEGRADSYLEPAIRSEWDFVKDEDVHYLPWSGNYADTPKFIENAKGIIDLLTRTARRDKRPFVIVSHSWGSVLAYRAIDELSRSGKLPEGSVDQFITLGSPLNSRNLIYRAKVRQYINWSGTAAMGGPVVVWRNYWIDEDSVSNAIDELGKKNIQLPYSKTRDGKAHSSYFNYEKSPLLWNKIGLDVRKALISAQDEKERVQRSVNLESQQALDVKGKVEANESRRQVKSKRELAVRIMSSALIQRWVSKVEAEDKLKRATDVTDLSLADIKLFMSYDTVIEILRTKRPDAKIHETRKGPCVSDRIMAINSGTRLNNSCITRVSAKRQYEEGQYYSVVVNFAEAVPHYPGVGIVVGVRYRQEYGKKKSSFVEFLKSVEAKYGPADHIGQFGNDRFIGHLKIDGYARAYGLRFAPPQYNLPYIRYGGALSRQTVVNLTVGSWFNNHLKKVTKQKVQAATRSKIKPEF